VAIRKLLKVSGPWAQRRRRSARAAIVTARFILAGVTKEQLKNRESIFRSYENLAESRNFQ
jgi:hypothetical protein